VSACETSVVPAYAYAYTVGSDLSHWGYLSHLRPYTVRHTCLIFTYTVVPDLRHFALCSCSIPLGAANTLVLPGRAVPSPPLTTARPRGRVFTTAAVLPSRIADRARLTSSLRTRCAWRLPSRRCKCRSMRPRSIAWVDGAFFLKSSEARYASQTVCFQRSSGLFCMQPRMSAFDPRRTYA
jgi:hypothetical protein